MLKVRTVALLATLLASLTAAEASAQGTVVTVNQCDGARAVNLFRFCYDGNKWLIDEPSNARFTNRDKVEVEVQHLNFLRFTLAFEVTAQASESYQYLTKLWTSVFNIGLGSFIGALGGPAADPAKQQRENEFVSRLRDLVRYTAALDGRLTAAIAAHQKPGLNKLEVTALTAELGTGNESCDASWPSGADSLLSCSARALRRDTVFRFYLLERGVNIGDPPDHFALATGKYADVYRAAKQAYAGVLERADLFERLSVKSLGVENRKVNKRDVGTKVTLTLAAVDAGGARTPMGDVSYVVETTIPLMVHAGFAVSKLRDVTFEKIKRSAEFSEEDLFQKTGDAELTKDTLLMMGWRLFGAGTRVQVLFSLGTGVSQPGKTIYAGPSVLLFDRVGITGGRVFSKVKDGELATLEPDVFRILKERPSSAWFLALTTRIF